MKCYVKDYPRPQFVRDNWENLNGKWDFAFDDENIGEQTGWFRGFNAQSQICVPFTYETEYSGICDESVHENVWYHRTIRVNKKSLSGHRYILHFEGSDYITKVWVNGQFCGVHKGGYNRFSFDITDYLEDGENALTVKVEDSLNLHQPRGKQRWLKDSYGCWYVQTTGIWKTVWAEIVPEVHLSYVKMTPDLSSFVLNLEFDVAVPSCRTDGSVSLETEVRFQGELVNRTRIAVTASHISTMLDMTCPHIKSHYYNGPVWTPDNPNLYDISFRLFDGEQLIDSVGSYAAMRQIRIDGSNILLNDMLLYQKLILDQGYWRCSHLTPPGEDALLDDISHLQAMGYNGVRIHQKVEDERFLYWCDMKGILVWCEAPSAYAFSDIATSDFMAQWLETVKQMYNHPCIITWTPLNESWGISKVQTNVTQQHFSEAIYHATKMIDPYRPVIVNDGWVHTVSDILTLHDYEADAEAFLSRYLDRKDEVLNGSVYFNKNYPPFACGYEYKGQPVLISEFGGVALDGDDSGWGYGSKASSQDAFIKQFDQIVSAIKKLDYVCGYCYTQLTDVQQEMNGLLDADHNPKFDREKICQINLRPINACYK